MTVDIFERELSNNYEEVSLVLVISLNYASMKSTHFWLPFS